MIIMGYETNILTKKNAGAAQAGQSALRRRISFLQKKRFLNHREG